MLITRVIAEMASLSVVPELASQGEWHRVGEAAELFPREANLINRRLNDEKAGQKALMGQDSRYREMIEERDASYRRMVEGRDASYRNLIKERDASYRRMIEDRDASYRRMIEERDASYRRMIEEREASYRKLAKQQDDSLRNLKEVIDTEFGPSDALMAEAPVHVPEVFVSDMDSTMIGQECIDELADFAGLKSQVAAITERAMQGELDFASALNERVRLLAGLPESAIDECLATRIVPMPGARVLVETLKAKGCRTILVTGGFHQFADPVARMLGFEHVVANRLEVSGGRLTGALIGPIVDSATKRQTLLAAGDELVSLATGDGANDIPMLEEATYGFAYHAKPKARAAANGWIDCGDLTSVLLLLGIAREEWCGEV